MNLYVFDRNLNFIGVVDTFTSLQWNRRYFKCGDFELQCPLTTDNLTLLVKGNIIWKQGDNEAGYIIYRDLKQDDSGLETLDIKGDFITGYLKQRIVWNQVNMTDTVENIMRTLVNQNCIAPSDPTRIIQNLALADLKSLSYQTTYQQSKHANLDDEIESLSSLSGLGHRITFNPKTKQLQFEVYSGIDRTVHQSVISPCIFSKEFENVLEQEYSESLDNYKNVCLVDGTFTYQVTTPKFKEDGTVEKDDKGNVEYETKDETMPVSTKIGNSSGLDRYETFLDSNSSSEIDSGNKDSSGNDVKTYLSQSDFLSVLASDGTTELAQYVESKSFDSKININSNVEYKTDFDLGDIVTCRSKKWGITIDARITEIQELYEEQGFQVNVIFGDAVPTLVDKIKRKVK